MMIFMSITQGTILGLVLIPLLILMGFVLTKFLLSSLKKGHESKMLSFNLVINLRKFMSYLEYKHSKKEDYALYLVSINNFNEIVKNYNDKVVKAYLKRTVKNLSIMLPYGGKLAQTKKRNTFILYVPNVYGSELEFANMLKESALTPLMVNGKKVLESISIGFTTSNGKAVDKQVEEANIALTASKRALNKIVKYSSNLAVNKEDYSYVNEKLFKEHYKIEIYDIIREKTHTSESRYYQISANNMLIDKYLVQLPTLERYWSNFNIIVKALNNTSKYVDEKRISIPVLLSTLEEENFLDELEVIIYTRDILIENVSLTIYKAPFNRQEKIVQNILKLKDLKVKLNYVIDSEEDDYYNVIKSLHIDKMIFDLTTKEFSDGFLRNIIEYSQVNQVETAIIGELKETNIYFHTHYSKELDIIEINKVKNNKKRGNK